MTVGAAAFEESGSTSQQADSPTDFQTTRADWTCFRDLNQLPARAGVQPHQLAALCAKELVDNAYDAGAPTVTCGTVPGGFYVEDDGRGIPSDQVAHLFSIARPMVSSKHLRRPTRGALGNGLRVVVGCVDLTGGSLIVETGGRRLRVVPLTDGTSRVEPAGDASTRGGTRVEVVLGAPLGVAGWRRWVDRIADLAVGGESYVGESSPHWYNAAAFYELCASAGDVSPRALVERLRGCSGAKAGRICDGFQGRRCASLSRAECATILARARASSKPVKPADIGHVGARGEHYARELGETADGIPFCVEAWAEPVDGSSDVLVHVNRTAAVRDLAVQRFEGTLHVSGCGLNEAIERVGKQDFRVWLHVTTAWMPIVDQGKVPWLATPGLRDAVVKAIATAARKANRANPECRDVQWPAGEPSQKEIVLAALPTALEHVRAGGHRFSLRQLFYAVRPAVLEQLGANLDYDYFGKLIGAHENDTGKDIPGMFRDPRGTLYHPHERRNIAIGTVAVEHYERPAWTFNKVLYIEKEGFFENLKSVGWPERHDCALLTSKGFSTRAVRDLLDLVGESAEPVTIFCVHDADGPGTMIYQTLVEETTARAARRVEVINLGLEADDALAMELDVETFPARERRTPVAAYVGAARAEWYQTRRVELNAMTTAQFLAWLDRQLAAHDMGKVVPPAPVLRARLHLTTHDRVRERVTERVLREAAVDAQVDTALAALAPRLEAHNECLSDDVAAALESEPADHWTAAVDALADELLDDETTDGTA